MPCLLSPVQLSSMLVVAHVPCLRALPTMPSPVPRVLPAMQTPPHASTGLHTLLACPACVSSVPLPVFPHTPACAPLRRMSSLQSCRGVRHGTRATYMIWPTSTDHSCRVRMTFPITTKRARAPQVRYTFPLFNLKSFYFSQYFSHLLPSPSGPSLGQTIGRFERTRTVVQSVMLTVELPSTTQGPTPTRTLTWTFSGLTLLGASQELRRWRAGRQLVSLYWESIAS